jgi:hypothetical protein
MQDNLDYDNGDRTSLVNAVCFANALAKKSGVYVGPFDADDVDAIVMIGRSLIGVTAVFLAEPGLLPGYLAGAELPIV